MSRAVHATRNGRILCPDSEPGAPVVSWLNRGAEVRVTCPACIQALALIPNKLHADVAGAPEPGSPASVVTLPMVLVGMPPAIISLYRTDAFVRDVVHGCGALGMSGQGTLIELVVRLAAERTDMLGSAAQRHGTQYLQQARDDR